jgi:hypothetical protein
MAARPIALLEKFSPRCIPPKGRAEADLDQSRICAGVPAVGAAVHRTGRSAAVQSKGYKIAQLPARPTTK